MSNKILTVDQIKACLEDRRLSVIEKKIGLSYPVLRKMQLGSEAGFNLNSILKISKYLTEQQYD